PVVGAPDVTREELSRGAVAALRLLAVSLAFAAYALLLDHDRLLRSVRAGRRATLAVVRAARVGAALRLLAVSLAFAAYALLLDHDRLLRSVRAGRRSTLAVVLATRLVPTLE